jgi:hypothetical protein
VTRTIRTGALALAAALAASPAWGQVSDLYGRAWLRVSEPLASELTVDLPLVEVGGYAGSRGRRGQDLMIVIDVSDSTIEPSGVDLDGDGESGTTDARMRAWLLEQPDVRESLIERVERFDFDDSVLMAELAAAYGLVTDVDARLFRVGIVAFSGNAWVVAPLGSSREDLLGALDHVRWNFFYDLGGTDFVDAIRVATDALDPPPPKPGSEEAEAAPAAPPGEEERRDKSILFLSDGAPTGGTGRWEAEENALRAARDAADRGVRVFTYALGPQAVQSLDVYRGMAELAGGRFEKVERPGDVVVELRSVDLMDLAELRVENLTTGGPARALRTFPDGSFDGLVELAPGENRLRFLARAPSGSVDVAERQVRYEPPAELDEEERVAREVRLEEMVERLRERTRETEFLREISGRKPPQRRELEVHSGDAAPRGRTGSPDVDAAPSVASPPPGEAAGGSGAPPAR